MFWVAENIMIFKCLNIVYGLQAVYDTIAHYIGYNTE